MSAKKQSSSTRGNIHNVIFSQNDVGGWTRQVAVDGNTQQAKEVVHIVNGNGNDTVTTTVQRIVEGDVIHRTIFIPKEGRKVSEILSAKMEGGNLILTPLSMVDEFGVIKHYSLDSTLSEFITDPSQSNLLPSGYGWDGRYTQTMMRRRTNFICFLAGFGLPAEELHGLVDVLINHSSNSVKISWRDALPIPDQDIQLPGPTTGQRDYWFIVRDTGETVLAVDPNEIVSFTQGDVLRAIHCQIKVSDLDQSKWVISAWELYSVEC